MLCHVLMHVPSIFIYGTYTYFVEYRCYKSDKSCKLVLTILIVTIITANVTFQTANVKKKLEKIFALSGWMFNNLKAHMHAFQNLHSGLPLHFPRASVFVHDIFHSCERIHDVKMLILLFRLLRTIKVVVLEYTLI